MTTQTEQLAEALRSGGYSLTEPRLQVFVALHGGEPLSMRELVSRCKGVDRASVYRTVSLFEQLGILQRLQVGWKHKLELSDAFQEHHHHASCLRCGTSVELPENDELETSLRTMAEAYGFRMDRHQLELQGLCRNCQQGSSKIA